MAETKPERQMIHYKETQYGFNWGAAKVERCFSDDKQGWVTLSLVTQKNNLQIYVTKTGKVRIYNSDGVEFLPNKIKEGKRDEKKMEGSNIGVKNVSIS